MRLAKAFEALVEEEGGLLLRCLETTEVFMASAINRSIACNKAASSSSDGDDDDMCVCASGECLEPSDNDETLLVHETFKQASAKFLCTKALQLIAAYL